MTAAVLIAEPPIADQVAFVVGDTMTYGQAADLVEQVSGKSLTREVWTLSQLRTRRVAHPENAMAKYDVVFAEGRGVAWSRDNTFNQGHHIPVTDLRQCLATNL